MTAKKVIFWMDFHVRSRRQKALTRHWQAIGEKMDYAIDVEVPDENIVKRMGGRRACVGCGATYHLVYASDQKRGNL